MPEPKPSPRKDRAWQARRKRAEALFASGERQSTIARLLEVSRQCVHNWYRAWQGDAQPRGRRARSNSGRRPKLNVEQLALVDSALRDGPRQHGFDCERWNLERIAIVIQRITGVRYHPSSVWRLLRTLGWSLRYPRRARQPQRVYVPRQWRAPTHRPEHDGKI